MDGECDDMCRTVHDLKKSFDRIFRSSTGWIALNVVSGNSQAETFRLRHLTSSSIFENELVKWVCC